MLATGPPYIRPLRQALGNREYIMNSFNLIENAADSLRHALMHIGPIDKADISDWKRSILDLSHTVELMFKERLNRINPSLMWSNVDKYPSPKALTVSSEQAFNRLKKIALINFSDEEENFIEKLRIKRNEIEHFKFTLEADDARILVGHILSFILRFADRELQLDWQQEHLDSDKFRILREYSEFYEQQLDAAETKITDEGIQTLDCPLCYCDTFNIETGMCLLCRYKEEVFDCEMCGEPYLYSSVEYEEAGLCSTCEYIDGYTAAHFEKY